MSTSTVDSVLRTSQAYCQQVCEKQTLDYGIAFYSNRFPAVAQVNQFCEVWIEKPDDVPKAIEQGEAWFAEQGLKCLRFAPAGGGASDELSRCLLERGFASRNYVAMLLTRWPEGESDDSLRVLPARAMRAAFRAVQERVSGASDEVTRDQILAVMDERLDDPPYDMFVAMNGKDPVGFAALYQVGDLARVIDMNIVAGAEHDLVAGALTRHALVLARRMALRNVITQVANDDQASIALFERNGFVADGALTEFERAV